MSCVPSSDLFDVPDGFDYCASPVCLSPGDMVGLSFTAQMGFVSALSVVALLGYVAVRYIKDTPDLVWPARTLVKTNVDGLMLNLLIADLIMSLGAILDVYWASKSRISCGKMCDAQGAIQLVGETSVALFTLAITVSTFISVIHGPIKASVWVWGSIAVGIWAFGALWAGIGGTLESFYAPTPYWCWINRGYKAQRIGAEYAWLWISGFGSILLYTPLYLMLRGNIKLVPNDGRSSLKWSWKKEGAASENPLLWYPFVYTITILPVSVIRWITFNGGHVNPAASFVAVSIFNLSGAVNVGLILFARAGVFSLRLTIVDDMLDDAPPQPADAQLPGAEFMREHGTGFGGPQVRSPRDSDSAEQNIGLGRGGEISMNDSKGDLMSPATLNKASELGPGQVYLESLGTRMSHP